MAEKKQKHTDQKRRKKGLAAVLGTLAVAAAAGAGLMFANEYTLELSIPEKEEITLEYGNAFSDEVTALFKGTIFHKEGIPVPVTKQGEADLTRLGDYEEIYRATYRRYQAEATRLIHLVDTTAPEITLVSDPAHYTSPIASYEEEGYQAVDLYDGDLTEQVTSVEADGKVTYTVADSSGNTAVLVRDILYKDEVPPEIRLKGEAKLQWEYGTAFEDPGAEASDDCDGDLTGQIIVEGTIDTTLFGSQELVYSVRDSYNNEATVSRTVEITDTKAPELSLSGDTSVYVQVGTDYKDAGYSAIDNADGDLTARVSVSGKPDTASAGVYTVKYSVSDSSGNEACASRTVYVYRKQTDTQEQNPGDKVVYLTFDDGPCKNTARLLDVLDKYNVKATFFVTNQSPSYQYLIGEEASRGHTVAIHSYSHEYSDIYSSEEAFFEDLNKMSRICEDQTGTAPTILRFPGGSSNGVSKKYCKGIMTKLTESVGKMGYKYADWNVLSGDAGETTSTEVVKQNIIDGIQKHKVSTVLQHDLWGFSVDAVEDVIKWGLANGYTFLPLTEESPMYHHSVNN